MQMRAFRGSRTVMSLRLCSRAPWTTSSSAAMGRPLYLPNVCSPRGPGRLRRMRRTSRRRRARTGRRRARGRARRRARRRLRARAGSRRRRRRSPGTRPTRARDPERHVERAAVARREQVGLAVAAPAPDRADRVDDEPRRQVAAGRRLRIAGHASAERPALGEDRRAAGTVDRTVDATAAEQRAVRGVDDRIDVLRRDVAADDLDQRHGFAAVLRRR